MYNAFDSFLTVETWHTCHRLDEERFFRALQSVVENPDFSPEDMAVYMRHRIGVDRNDDENPFNHAIDHYTDAAWAVKDYLRVVNS